MSSPLNPASNMSSSDDAEDLCEKTKNSDQFPNIPPALLNSADIHDYIEATGMVYPYDPNLLKSSSYEVQIGDQAIYWDEEGLQKIIDLKNDQTVELRPNSLVFFKTKQEFRLPPYIAIRFNLRITNVHRGLLLGTGPLVDPGFKGNLLIPIHNLTNNTYYFKGDEPFIWVEFTKISPNKSWDETTLTKDTQNGTYVPFPIGKLWLKPWQYFQKAHHYEPISNAMPAFLAEVNEIAHKADNRVKILTFAAIFAAVTAVVGFYPLITGSLSLSHDVSTIASELRTEYQDHIGSEHLLRSKINALEKDLSDLKLTIQDIDKKTSQRQAIEQIQRQIHNLQLELDKLKAMVTNPGPTLK